MGQQWDADEAPQCDLVQAERSVVMVKFLALALGVVLVYLGATGRYKDVGQVLGVVK
jgi:hypothetical protein